VGAGFLVDYAAYVQNAQSKEQIAVTPGEAIRDFRFMNATETSIRSTIEDLQQTHDDSGIARCKVMLAEVRFTQRRYRRAGVQRARRYQLVFAVLVSLPGHGLPAILDRCPRSFFQVIN
jgi:hypothetical protein